MAGNFAGATRWPSIRALLTLVPAILLAGCLHGGGSGSSSSNSPSGNPPPSSGSGSGSGSGAGSGSSAPPPASTQSAPTISGTPALTALTGVTYSFIPNVGDADGDPLTLSVQNLPSWATFNSSTGEIRGTPGIGDVGTYSNIRVAVSDGERTTQLAPFQIVVQQNGIFSATLSWLPPTTDANGAPLLDLAGYRIHYGTQPGNPSTTVTINNPGVTRFVVENLNAGRYYFSISAYDVNGNSSSRSSEVSGLVG
mgnify:CR=1 FL=1